MSDFIQVYVDSTEIQAYSNAFRGKLHNALTQAAAKIAAIGPRKIGAVVQAVGSATSNFPQEYTDHISWVARDTIVQTAVIGTGIEVSYDFSQLGGWDDLEEAYHRDAALEAGGTVTGPYMGEELKNPRQWRYEWWEDNSRIWDDSWAKKVAIWGNIAPEWLFLEYGNTTIPETEPAPLVEAINQALAQLAFAQMEIAVLSAALNESLSYVPTTNYQTTKSIQASKQNRDAFGRFAPGFKDTPKSRKKPPSQRSRSRK